MSHQTIRHRPIPPNTPAHQSNDMKSIFSQVESRQPISRPRICPRAMLRTMTTRTAMPAGLPTLVKEYESAAQPDVAIRVPSWNKALADLPTNATGLLTDERYSHSAHRSTDRLIGRAGLLSACDEMDLANEGDVVRTFVLVMAWGSGLTGSRTLRNTARALGDTPSAHKMLGEAALRLRNAESFTDGALEQAHKDFHLAGIGQAFFTKWFTFAGHVPGRAWQPLILDSRVYATLNQTLGADTKSMAGGARYRKARYRAYVETMHSWSDELSRSGLDATPQRLEWVLFQQNGKALQPSG
jgi:hypothetical protein